MEQRSASDPHLIDGVILTALGSMAVVDGPLTPDALLVEVDIDSLDLVELTQILEEECEVTVSASAFADVASVGDVLEVVRRHLA